MVLETTQLSKNIWNFNYSQHCCYDFHFLYYYICVSWKQICLRQSFFYVRRTSHNIRLYLLTYLLTPWCRVLDKLTGLQLVKKFPAFHGTRRFITAPTSVRHLPLSWSSPIHSIYPHPTSWRSILILSTHLCLGLPM